MKLFRWKKRKDRGVRASNYITDVQTSGQLRQSDQVALAIHRLQEYYKSRHESEDRRAKKDFWWTGATASFAFVAAISTAIAAGFSGFGMKAAIDSAEQARRQADYAAQSSPRSWVYIEFPSQIPIQPDICGSSANIEIPFVPFKCIYNIESSDGIHLYVLSLDFSITNYGIVPATITSADAFIYYAVDPGKGGLGPPINKRGALSSGFAVSRIETFDNLGVAGDTIAPEKSISREVPPGNGFHFRRSESLRQHFGSFPSWVRIIINYRDPFGADRQTSRLIEASITGLRPVVDSIYTYNK